ncbi:MAG: hypothetical protein ACKVPX_08590 [Myxococcaceae bacterium]
MATKVPKFSSSYRAVSGPAYDRCAFLAERHPSKVESFRPRVDESIVVVVSPEKQPGKIHVNLVDISNGVHCGLWMSPEETLFVATRQDRVLRLPKAFRPRLTYKDYVVDEIRSTLSDVWGLSADFVLTWGIRGVGEAQEYPVFRFDGKKWKEIPSPKFDIYAMHGLSPDLVYAVGDGAIAVWNGAKWKRVPAPVEQYTSVFVASPTEVYAVGRTQALVVEGGPKGFKTIAALDVPLGLDAVTKWKGDLWVGAESAGLFKRVVKTKKFELVHKGVRASSFDVRDSFVMSCPTAIATTLNGKDFLASARDAVLDIRGAKPLHKT